MSYEDIIARYSRKMDVKATDVIASGNLREPVESVLFDIYGTLFISSAGDISLAEESSSVNIKEIGALIERYGIAKKAGELSRELYDEIDRTKKSLRNTGIDYPEVVIEDIWSSILGWSDVELIRRFAVEYELIVNPVYPMPHGARVLSMLKEQGTPIGIISNAQFYTPHLFTALMGGSLAGLGFHEDLVFFSYLSGYCKPSSFLFDQAVKALEKRGVARKHVLYVGNDMLKDIMPAAEAGFQTALFAGDLRSLRKREDDERCAGTVPNIVIKDLLQIMDVS